MFRKYECFEQISLIHAHTSSPKLPGSRLLSLTHAYDCSPAFSNIIALQQGGGGGVGGHNSLPPHRQPLQQGAMALTASQMRPTCINVYLTDEEDDTQGQGHRGWVPRTEPYCCPACGHRSYRGKILANHLQKCCPDLITEKVSPSLPSPTFFRAKSSLFRK